MVKLVQPKLLLLTGKAAAHTVLKREDGVMKLRGRRLLYNREGQFANAQALCRTLVAQFPRNRLFVLEGDAPRISEMFESIQGEASLTWTMRPERWWSVDYSKTGRVDPRTT